VSGAVRAKRPVRLGVHFSSAKDDWATPPTLFDALNEEFHFTLDPCATPDNAKCRHFFTQTDDGLAQDWKGETVFMNPPYGRAIGRWMGKAHDSARQGAAVVCLIPARTDTRWWHEHALKGEIRFLRGRLKFGDAHNSAPFPSAIVVFRPASTVRRLVTKCINFVTPPAGACDKVDTVRAKLK
jgi:site-specific DNA-methyltransferase (adenine-specific)